jgi:hypothetical protein
VSFVVATGDRAKGCIVVNSMLLLSFSGVLYKVKNNAVCQGYVCHAFTGCDVVSVSKPFEFHFILFGIGDLCLKLGTSDF